ncbi:MAG: hypothetical protein Q8K00_11365 [Syntrophales bacterium]|nr:hypothetical protein [Syntrophales bacterium]
MKSRITNKTRILCLMTLSILLSLVIAFFPPIFCQAEEPQTKGSLLQLLPLESDLKGWKLDGEPQTAEGIRLFELINGGAEEYVKEGFSRAVIATYRNNEGTRINLDIYEMLSPENAKNIHRKKASDKGQKVSVGEEAAMEDYYLNFRKGPYQVTLSGYDTQRETLEWLLLMARLVAERIR